MQGTWIVLLPPLIVLASAFISRDIIISLVAGIVSAAFIATDFSPTKGALLAIKSCQNQLIDLDNIYLFAFLFVVGMIVSLIGATGGAHAFGKKLTKKIKTADGVQKAALSVPFLLFIDDYLNCLTVGHVMHPLTDKFKVPRAKLAFFIDSMTAPLAIITPISSWAGTIISQFELSGITLNTDEKPIILADSFYTYLKVIPFTFYSFIIMSTAWFIVYRKISFGTMQKHEQIAMKTGNVFGGKSATKDQAKVVNNYESSIWDMLLPVTTLVGLVIVAVLYLGNHWLFGGSQGLVGAFQAKYNIFLVLFSASTFALLFSLFFAIIRKKIKLNNLLSIIINGLKIMWIAVLTVLLAWAFSFLLREYLHTGNYLADILIGKINIILLPLMLFITTSIVSVLTGSSWGAIAIMLPITVPIVLTFLNAQAPIAIEYVGFIFPCLGAVLSGAAAGDHISPISDTTIMSSVSSGSYHIDHVRTQFEYSWPAILGTALSFLISGLLAQNHPTISIIISLFGGIGLTFGILSLLNKKK